MGMAQSEDPYKQVSDTRPCPECGDVQEKREDRGGLWVCPSCGAGSQKF